MLPSDRFERVVSGVLALSALVVATVFVYSQLGSHRAPAATAPGISVSHVDDWQELLEAGRQVAGPVAPVQLIEFIDLECPACQLFARTLQGLLGVYGDSLGITLVHYPLPMHRYAWQAARVAECGAREGKFAELISAILDDRDSLSLGRWSHYGALAGIRDRDSFESCYSDGSVDAAIQRGVRAGDRIRIRATPTVIVNGWRFSAPPTESELRQAIDAILRGKKLPFPGS